MKTIIRNVLMAIVFFTASHQACLAQPAADLVLTGSPSKSVYPGYPVAGTFDVTLANNTNVNIPPLSFQITFSLPTGFAFNTTYPGVPAGWVYLKLDDLDATLTPSSTVSGTIPSFVSFSVPFMTTAAVSNQPYLAQINRLLPTYIDNDQSNNTPSGTVSVSNTVLPVDFVSINATIKNCAAEVDWKVANQVNLKQYELESSTDGMNFTTGKVVPVNNLNAYSAELPVSGNSTYFYRVKAVDLDGSYKFSAITSVKANCDGKQGAFMMYPNPVLKGKQVILSSTTNESTMYRILDMAGKTVQEGRFTGNTSFQINTGGAYIVDLQSASANTKYKLVVQ